MSGAWYSHLYPRMGLSADAIAHGGTDYPRDPGDLVRCIAYCDRSGISTEALRHRMGNRSPEWSRLVAVWDDLTAMLRHEVETRADGSAPHTYAAMKCATNDGLPCPTCDSTGRGVECPKCKGTGRRSGGKCRAPRCYRGADYCTTCHGATYVTKPASEREDAA